MKFDIQKLEQSVQQYKVAKLSSQDLGAAKVIQYVWNHTDTKEIDFNSFTLNDTLRTFYDFYSLPHSDDDELSAADIVELRKHPWEINARLDDVINALAYNKNRVYENDDDFI